MKRSLPCLAIVIAVGAWSSVIGTTQAPPPPPQPVVPQTGAPAPGQPRPGQVTPTRTPPRDAGPRTGTAILRGRVIDAVTGNGVRNVRVNASSPPPSPANGFALTDAEGNFEIRALPSGRYQLSAMRNSYLNARFGQKAYNDPGTPLDVLDGQLVEKIIIRMSRGGVISGRIFDEFGEPVSDVDVRALRYRYVNGRRQLSQTGMGRMLMTDDLGGFRLWGLEPGEYYVSANPRRDPMPILPGQQNTPPVGHTQTYFPGTPSPIDAKRVTVQAGRETGGIAFTLVSARLARIRGRAVLSSGEPFPPGSFVQLAYRNEGGGSSSTGGGTVRPDGTFEVANVPPGSYQLQVRPNTPMGPMGPEADPTMEIGREFVAVNGEDVNDLLIVGSRGAIARGRIVTDEGVAMPDVKNTSISVEPMDPDRSLLFRSGPPPRPKDDGSFELTGLFDRIRLRPFMTAPMGMPPTPAGPSGPTQRPWVFKAVMYDGRDVSDRGIDFQPGQIIEGIEVVFTRTVQSVRGRLLDDRGATAQGWVIIFPADETLWVPLSRYIRPGRPSPDGEYRMSNLPAYDDYLIIGVATIEDGQWFDPETLQVLKQHASSLSLRDGETKVHDVKLTRITQ